MTKATSCYFVAILGVATSEAEERIEHWARNSCASHRISRDEDGRLTLHARRREAKSARVLQAHLRTLTSTRWKMHLGELPKGWLRLLSSAEFDAAVQGGALDDGGRPEQEDVSDSDAIAMALPTPTRTVIAQGLSPEFAKRSQEILRDLVAKAH